MRAKRSLGQNFLRDTEVIGRIVAALEIAPGDRVLEIGPGHGALTGALLDAGAEVTAIEFDDDLVPELRERFGKSKRFSVIHDDALAVDMDRAAGDKAPVKFAANLPYNISTPILQRLIDDHRLFSVLLIMLQREVVDRITAAPGDSDRGFLTVLVENVFSAERLFDVPPEAFRPIPKVWSSVVRLTPKQLQIEDASSLRRLLSSAFAQKRKTIHNNLKAHYPDAAGLLHSVDIDPRRRAETLTLDEWSRLASMINDKK